MHSLYILHSKKIDRYYIGESKNATKRLELHNKHHFKKGFTKAADDWKISLDYQCKSKEDAVFLEKFIKKMKSKKFVEKIIVNPHILSDILLNK